MIKRKLIGVILLISTSIIAGGKNDLQRMHECDGYWDPIIAEFTEAKEKLANEWNNMNSWQRDSNPEVWNMMCRMENKALRAQDAKGICYKKGLEKSKEEWALRDY